LILEQKRTKIQKYMFDKQFGYFKDKNKVLNETQMCMVRKISNLTKIMGTILKQDKDKNPFLPQ
jgi:hypothetical protein